MTSRDSTKNNQMTSPRNESSFEKKRDAYILRFKQDNGFRDKVIQENQRGKELGKTASDPYWQELQSITLTPIAKVGLGKLFTFEFIAPCFEDKQPRSLKEKEKLEKMSFYGRVRFDYRQFGNDNDKLKKEQPQVYCLKMCHIMGFYL